MARCNQDDFKKHGQALAGVAAVPGAKNRAIVASLDRKIWNTADGERGFDTKYNVSSVVIMANCKTVFTGFGEAGHPGAIQIWRMPLSHAQNEVQAHSAPIVAMRLNFYNDRLFTAGKDGCLMIHEVKDREARIDQGKVVQPTYSDEILAEKSEIEESLNLRDTLFNDLVSAKDINSTNVSEQAAANNERDKIKKLEEQI